MIDPAIWESIDFSKLSAAAKIVFIGLFSFADDEGRGRATASYLKSKLFAFSDEMSNAGVKKCLREISQHMSITFYADAKGDEYYTLDNWRKWQRLDRPAESQLPKYDARTCKLLYASKSKSCAAPDEPAAAEPKPKSPAAPQTNAPNPKTQPAPEPRSTGTKTDSPATAPDEPAATAQTAKPALQADAQSLDEPSTSVRRAFVEPSTHDAAKTFYKREEERELELEREREVEKEREAQVSKIAPSALSPPLDLSFSLREKVDEWFKYKSERNEAYMPTGQKAFITTVCNNSKRYNEKDIIELISLSMSNGWKGVFWDRLDKRGTGKAKTFKQPQPRPRKAGEFW